MKPLLPTYCRPLGYLIIAIAVVLPFVMYALGQVNDSNLLLYKECSKLLIMAGTLMIIFALSRHEDAGTEQIRNQAVRNAMFLAVLFFFGNMLYRVWEGDLQTVDTSTFLVFLLLNVICLEFGMKKAIADRLFKREE